MNSQRGTTTEAYLQPYDNWMKSARERAVESDQRATFDGFGKSQPRWLDHIFYRHAKAVNTRLLTEKITECPISRIIIRLLVPSYSDPVS